MTTIGKVDEMRREFEWKLKIKNLSSLPLDSRVSPKVLYNGIDYNIVMECYSLNSAKARDPEWYISIRIHSSKSLVNMSYSLGLKKVNGRKIIEEYFGCGESFKFLVSDLMERKSQFLPSDVLTIICVLDCHKPTENKSDPVSVCLGNVSKSECNSREMSFHSEGKHIDKSESTKVWKNYKYEVQTEDELTDQNFRSIRKKEVSIHTGKCMDKPGCTNDWNNDCKEETKANGKYFKNEFYVKEVSTRGKYFDNPSSSKQWNNSECNVKTEEDERDVGNSGRFLPNIKSIENHREVAVCLKKDVSRDGIVTAQRMLYESKTVNSGKVPSKGLNNEAWKTFNRFVSTKGEIHLSGRSVCEIYEAANTCQQEGMKEAFLNRMREELNVDNFCDYVSLALRHNQKDLLQKGVELFRSHHSELVRSPNWGKFVKEHHVDFNKLLMRDRFG